MNPIFQNVFMKKLTRERVVPIISASIFCELPDHSVRLILLPVTGKQQQRTS